jgi:hypothetical protein
MGYVIRNNGFGNVLTSLEIKLFMIYSLKKTKTKAKRKQEKRRNNKILLPNHN